MNKITEDWALYEAGKKYNEAIINPNDISYYDMIDSVIAFYNGSQWRGVTAEDLPKPVFNYIKRGITFFIASLMSNNVAITFENIEHISEEQEEMITIINSEVKNVLEKWKIENRIRDLLFDGAVTGDFCTHFYFDPEAKVYDGTGKINIEILDGSNVLFGNANNPNVEDQPYIIIVGRDIARNLQEEAKQYKQEITVDEDREYDYMPGDNGKVEVEADKYGKALYILIYRRDKKTGTIHVSKSVKNDYIYEDIDTGLEYYPIAWGNWEKQKNQYHGKGTVIDMIPNQIAINKMFAMVIYHLMLTAFPTPIYNGDKLSEWTNELGGAIELHNLEIGESIKNVAGYLEPSQMSGYIITAVDNAIKYTKECMGISDASLGGIDPKNATAIIAVQKSAIVPLENVRANLFEFIEDMGRILLDMIGTYYGTRKVIVNVNDTKQIVEYDFTQIKGKWLSVKADVGTSAYFSELAAIQTLDNLLASEKIDFLQYLERMPDNMIPKKSELIADLKERMGQSEQQQQAMTEQEYEQLGQYFDSLPPEVQTELQKLPDAQLEQTIMEMMRKDPELQQDVGGV